MDIAKLIVRDMNMKIENEVAKAAFDLGFCIDKEALRRALEDTHSFYQEGYKDGYAEGYHKVISEIVHCKECKHRIDDKEFTSGHFCIKRRSNGGKFCEDNDFCSYGERREL